MKIRLLCVLGILTLVIAPDLFAQERTITGVVTSAEDGEPLPGVNIVIAGTVTGTITDAEGEYLLPIPSTADTLVFSFVGYQTVSEAIADRSVINVALTPATEELGELVVIGYGEKSRRMLTESIGTIDTELIQKLPVVSPDQALQGRISGVQVTNVSGLPGTPVAMRIRGVSTVGNTQPLFVIDGVPVGKAVGGNSNPLATINPSDIENISVLKDASAAAAYGVRAANGVVIITTKRGQSGKPTINFDSYYGIQEFPKLWDMLSTSELIAMEEEAIAAYNTQMGLQPGDQSYLVMHPDLASNSRYRSIDNSEAWIKDAANENAPIQNYNLSVSGASDRLNYYVSAGYFTQQAIINHWDLERLNFRANGDYAVTDWLKIGQTFSISHQFMDRGMNGGGDGFLLRNAATMPPFFEIYDTDGSVPNNRYGYDGNLGVAGITRGNQNGINMIRWEKDRNTRLIGSLNAEVKLPYGFLFNSRASLDYGFNRNDNWQPPWTAAELGFDRSTENYGDSRGEGWTRVFTNTLNWVSDFRGHSVNAIGGIEVQEGYSTSLGYTGLGFLSLSPDFFTIAKNAREIDSHGGGAGESAYVGYFGRVSYDFRDRYLLTATLRRDGSSRFSPEGGRRWGTFPSVSAAWRLSEEPFFRGVPGISELKLRGSWGRLGNDETAAYPHIFRISVTPDYGLGGSRTVQAPAPFNFVNKDVTWETVETVDFGVDASLFNNRLDVLATYFHRTTRDFLVSIPIPQVTGFGRTSVNAGSVLNKGFEFEVDYNFTLFNDLNLDIGANLTTVDNELTELSEGISEFLEGGGYRTAVGFPIGYIYGYKADGLYQSADEAAAALQDKVTSHRPQPGDVRFVDINRPVTADDDVPDGTRFIEETDGIISPEDRTYLGKTIPDYYYGLNVNGYWKNFDMSVFFQGVGGVQLYNQFRQASMGTSGLLNKLDDVQDRWKGPGTSDDVPRAVANDPYSNNRFSDRWVENGDFFRLKNIQIGYSLPQSLLRNQVSRARIYLSMTNLFTISPYSGLDPEIMTYRSNGSQIGQDVSVGNPPSGGSGTDEGNVPQPRTYQFGLQIQF